MVYIAPFKSVESIVLVLILDFIKLLTDSNGGFKAISPQVCLHFWSFFHKWKILSQSEILLQTQNYNLEADVDVFFYSDACNSGLTLHSN